MVDRSELKPFEIHGPGVLLHRTEADLEGSRQCPDDRQQACAEGSTQGTRESNFVGL